MKNIKIKGHDYRVGNYLIVDGALTQITRTDRSTVYFGKNSFISIGFIDDENCNIPLWIADSTLNFERQIKLKDITIDINIEHDILSENNVPYIYFDNQIIEFYF